MIVHNKLVRDRIPEIIEREGQRPNVRVLDEDEYRTLLTVKLGEEADEYRSGGDPGELVERSGGCLRACGPARSDDGGTGDPAANKTRSERRLRQAPISCIGRGLSYPTAAAAVAALGVVRRRAAARNRFAM